MTTNAVHCDQVDIVWFEFNLVCMLCSALAPTCHLLNLQCCLVQCYCFVCDVPVAQCLEWGTGKAEATTRCLANLFILLSWP